jgi:hypothetical protein
MKLLDRSYSLISSESTSDRRRFLTRVSGVGAAVVGAIAFTWLDDGTASAATPCNGNYLCCDLAHPNGPYCGGHIGTSSFSCPSGYSKRFWTCCCQECCVDCYECAKGSSCFDGPWACSNAVATCGGGG